MRKLCRQSIRGGRARGCSLFAWPLHVYIYSREFSFAPRPLMDRHAPRLLSTIHPDNQLLDLRQCVTLHSTVALRELGLFLAWILERAVLTKVPIND